MTDHALSRRLSYLLRHAPHEAGLTLAPGGWVPLAPLLLHLNVTRAQVEAVVAGSDKHRFALRGDHVRANQGHSVPVDLQLEPATPPARLFHGTHAGALPGIREGGLRPMNRHHVHLSQRFSGVLRGSLSTPETSEARSRPHQRLEVELKGVLLALQWNWKPLSPDPDTARRVGARRGPPVILTVRAGEMHAAGHLFLVSENGVWLADTVPPAYIDGA